MGSPSPSADRERGRLRVQVTVMAMVVMVAGCGIGFGVLAWLWDLLPGKPPAVALWALRSKDSGQRERGASDLQLAVMLHSVKPEEVDDVIVALLVAMRDEELRVRSMAARALFSFVFDCQHNSKPMPKTEAVVVGWLGAMKDKDHEVRRLAALALANIYFTYANKGLPPPP